MTRLRHWLAALREGAWLNAERVAAYCAMAVGAYVMVVGLMLASSHDARDAIGQPLGTDFISFWAAGSLALKGEAPRAYQRQAHAAEESAAFGGAAIPYYTWTYPPIFLLAVAVLALLPYGWALLAWLATTGALYVACVRRWLPHPRTALAALAFPAVLVELGHGQNAFLSTALLGFGLLVLETRPVLAGVLFGLLCFKPQIALLVPLALLAGGRWRALLASAATVIALYLGTIAVFGSDIWFLAYDASIAIGKQKVLEQGAVEYYKMASVFAAVRLAGGSVAAAWAVQWLASIGAGALVVWGWRSRAAIDLKVALLVTAVPLATPFFLDYDLMVLAIPLAILAREGLKSGFLPWERTVMFALFVAPGLSRGVGAVTGVPLAPLLVLVFAAVVAQRLQLSRETPGLPAVA